MLREYIISEAMHALGIPTTRSLAVVATGRPVRRETVLPGAVLARVASSHLRVGTFQYAAATGDVDLLRRLADHAISRHHPDAADLPQAEHRYLALFEAVVAAQASLVARWMLVGFVHGVMNTDNMTISGETIDYGPCAFLDAFDPGTVFSSIDAGGRYAYGNQPLAAEWNLARLAEALLPLFSEDEERAIELAMEALGRFREQYAAAFSAGMRAKLGLPHDVEVDPLIDELLTLLQANHVDYTSFFRGLGSAARGDAEPVRGLVLDLAAMDEWLQRWRALGPDPQAMDQVNPVYIPRNHLVEEALAAAVEGDLDPLGRLLEAVTAPFDERPGLDRYAGPAPEDFGAYVTFCGT
jgi:serine/tyrosine/threonine adenylyltransferase